MQNLSAQKFFASPAGIILLSTHLFQSKANSYESITQLTLRDHCSSSTECSHFHNYPQSFLAHLKGMLSFHRTELVYQIPTRKEAEVLHRGEGLVQLCCYCCVACGTSPWQNHQLPKPWHTLARLQKGQNSLAEADGFKLTGQRGQYINNITPAGTPWMAPFWKYHFTHLSHEGLDLSNLGNGSSIWFSAKILQGRGEILTSVLLPGSTDPEFCGWSWLGGMILLTKRTFCSHFALLETHRWRHSTSL